MEMTEKEFIKMPSDTLGTYSDGVILREVSLEVALRDTLIHATVEDGRMYKK